MKKEWFIDIEGKSEGPYSVDDLKRDRRITPDTYVWKEGFHKWKHIRDVPELRDLFYEEQPVTTEENFPKLSLKKPQEELVLDLKQDPPYFLWVLIILIIVLYLISQYFWEG